METKLKVGIGLFEKSVASIAAVLVIAIPVAIYYVRTEQRLDTLEALVLTYSTGIAIGTSISNQTSSPENGVQFINPLWARCDDLVDRATTLAEGGHALSAESIKDLIMDLKCDGSGQ